MRGKWLLPFLFVLFSPGWSCAQPNALSLGFGFGFLNPQQKFGQVDEGRDYYFLQLSYAREIRLIRQHLFLVLEPYVGYVQEPEMGFDGGLGLMLRAYTGPRSGFFFGLGAGGAYTTVDFKGQGAHGLFILQGGLGYKRKGFFIENRFRHYSNAGLILPNDSVNANIISIGFEF